MTNPTTNQEQQRKRAEVIACTIAPTLANRPGLCDLASAIHLALDATDVDAAAWAAFNAGQEPGERFHALRASHALLVNACRSTESQLTMIKEDHPDHAAAQWILTLAVNLRAAILEAEKMKQ